MKTKIALALTALFIAATIAATEAHKQDTVFVPYNPGYPVEFTPYMPGYPIDLPVVATPRNSVYPTVEPTPIKDPSI